MDVLTVIESLLDVRKRLAPAMKERLEIPSRARRWQALINGSEVR
jgi:hypothetical protein